ncbi:DNA-binding protein [Undibacterium arcticum]
MPKNTPWTPSSPLKKQLIADIDRLREQFPQTQDLYREVCVAMFFRYGMTPTANKLYQLVRKGSMSAPAEALNRFWEKPEGEEPGYRQPSGSAQCPEGCGGRTGRNFMDGGADNCTRDSRFVSE